MDGSSLTATPLDRLACLVRHWTWADEAMTRFERELSGGGGWDDDEDPVADHPFGSYYHWCALLCGIGEAAIAHALFSPAQMDAIRPDLDESLPDLRACRELLVTIPPSLERHPRIVDLLRDEATLGRLRRLHQALGEALRSRALDLRVPE